MRSTDKYVFFWSGPFSQWAKSKFVVDGIEYNTAEQFMMASKARLFGDDKTLSKIMNTKDPRAQKKLGREVKNFDASVWDVTCIDLVANGNYAKFTQSKSLKQLLLDTGDKTIVEASPYDKIWGIGMAEDHPDILDESKWLGTNYLGKALMIVRDKIRNGN